MQKNYTLLAIILIFSLNIFSQTPGWQWANTAGGIDYDNGYSIVTDAGGNVYTTGAFKSSSITFGTTTLTSSGIYDMFIVKYDSSGNVLWAKSAGGSDYDYGYGITTDLGGNVYVTGVFRSTSIAFDSTLLLNAGVARYDMFIVKYDAFGNVLWAKSAGGTNDDFGKGISADNVGNVFVTGWFSSDSIAFGTTTLTNASSWDTFIAKYDASGNILWAESPGGIGLDYGACIATNIAGDVYVAGYFQGASITFGTTVLVNTGPVTMPDMYFVKYSTSGNVLWAKSEGGTNIEHANGIATDVMGNVIITGHFYSDTINFGSTTVANAGYADMFVLKYDSSGNILWVQTAGNLNDELGNGVSTDVAGNVYVAGYFNSSSLILGATTLTNAGSGDIFIVKYDSSGNLMWAKSAGGTGDDYGNSIATDVVGSVYVTGVYKSPAIAFGSIIMTNANGGFNDVFVTKIGSGPVGLEQIPAIGEVSFFPNPSSEKLKVQMNGLKAESIEFYDLLGKKVLHRNPSPFAGELVIDISELAPGLYFIKVNGKDFSVAGKFVKQ